MFFHSCLVTVVRGEARDGDVDVTFCFGTVKCTLTFSDMSSSACDSVLLLRSDLTF